MDRLKMVKEHETLMKRLRRGKLGASTIHARRRMGPGSRLGIVTPVRLF